MQVWDAAINTYVVAYLKGEVKNVWLGLTDAVEEGNWM